MKIAHAHRAIIRQANELGYFPDEKQAKLISRLWAGKHFSAVGVDRFKQLSPGEELAIAEAAIKEVMEGKYDPRSEDRIARNAFYESNEGKALRGGKTQPWKYGQGIIERANELGYFPTKKQVTEINCLAGSRGWHGMSEDESNVLMDWAIKEFMEKASQASARRK